MSEKTIIHLASVLWDEEQENPFLVLEDSEGKGFAFPVGVGDAMRVIPGLRGDWPNHTSSETSLAQLLQQLKARAVELNIYAATQSSLYTCLVYRHGLSTHRLDLSVGDAICFSLRYNCPLTLATALWKALTGPSPHHQAESRKDSQFYIIPHPTHTMEKAV